MSSQLVVELWKGSLLVDLISTQVAALPAAKLASTLYLAKNAGCMGGLPVEGALHRPTAQHAGGCLTYYPRLHVLPCPNRTANYKVTGVGVEDLEVSFPWTAYLGHHEGELLRFTALTVCQALPLLFPSSALHAWSCISRASSW